MNRTNKTTGQCLCGDVRYEGNGKPIWVAHCHCKLCQRHSGAAFLTYIGFAIENLTWTQKIPANYSTDDGVERGFCARCGSSMTFARPALNEISVFAGTLDNPDSIKPTFHMFYDHHFSWLEINDENPRYARFPPGGEDRDTE